MKRILAVFLTLAMALNIAPVAAFAAADSDAASIVAVEETDEPSSSQLDEETARAIVSDPFLQAASAQTEQEQTSQAKVDTSDVSMEATDSFGKLLLAGMDEQQTNGTGDGTKKIIGVTVSGNTATVEYVSDMMENLVVAIYTDDTEQEMVASGRIATFFCQDGKARTDEVKLTGDIPSSFVVKAYLLDYSTYEPLCNAFVSNQYTGGMQELEDATINDFDEARTINLDGDVTTNFAVVNEGVELLKPEGAASDENRVAMQDDESLTYVIENADSRVLGLQPGDILVYPQDEGGMLIVKVKDISVSGTTATITGDEDIDLSEVFAVLKIEDSASTEDFEYEQGSAEGVTYAGMTAVPAALGMENGKEVGKDDSIGKELVVNKELGSLKITGGVYATLGYGIKVMLDGEEKYISTYLDAGLTGTVTLTGKYNEAFEIGELGYTNSLIGLYAGIKPTIEVTADAYVEFTFKANKYNGFEYTFTGTDVKNGTVTDTSKPAECELYTEAKGSLYVGINLNPETYVLWKVVDVTMDARIGVTGDFKLLGADEEDPAKESLHTCDYCMTFNLTGSAELTVHLKVSLQVLVVSVKSQWDKQLFTTNWQIGEAYYSVVHDEFGWGACPYRTYRVKVAAGTNGANAVLSVTKGGGAVLSNKLDANGEYNMFLEPGNYTVKLFANNKEYTQDVTVGNRAQTVEFAVDNKNPDTGETVGSGKCGDNLTWKLDANGTLTISGSGKMYKYGVGSLGVAAQAPWQELRNDYPVKKLVLSEGITSIGACAFEFSKIETLDIPSTVTEIDVSAFEYCDELTTVTGGENVTIISPMAFMGCSELTSFQWSDKLQAVRYYAFKSCKKLNSVELASSVTEIGMEAFKGCEALATVIYHGTEKDWNNIQIQEGNDPLLNAKRTYVDDSTVTSGTFGDDNLTWALDENGTLTISGMGAMPEDYLISEYPWYAQKEHIKEAVIKPGVTNVGRNAFYDCKALTKVTLPDGVTSIGRNAFGHCELLSEIALPDSVTSIGMFAFDRCAMTELKIPDNVTSIGSYAFSSCESLKEIAIPNGVTKIEDYTFGLCKALQKVTIPNSVTSIGKSAFSRCEALKEITIPSGVTSIAENTFENCSSLTKITIPDGVASIGNKAFYNCDSLPEIAIPSGVTSIGNEIFYSCSSLTEIVIPAGVTSIGDGAFRGCVNLKKIVIPVSVTKIGAGAFHNFWSVKQDVYYTGTQEQWNCIQIGDNNDFTMTTIHYNYSSGGTFGGDGGGGRLSLDDVAPSVENSITTGTATEKSGTYYATFKNAKAGKEYVVLVSREKYNPFGANSLIYINQITADADGELAVPFITTAGAEEMKYIVACAQDDATVEPGKPDKPDNPGGDKPSSGGGDGGGAAIILIGGVAAVAAVAGVVLMMPVEVSGTVKIADQPVANASVQVLKNGSVTAQTTTDANGHFTVKVKRGDYNLRVQWTDAEGQPVERTVDFKAPNANLNVAA